MCRDQLGVPPIDFNDLACLTFSKPSQLFEKYMLALYTQFKESCSRCLSTAVSNRHQFVRIGNNAKSNVLYFPCNSNYMYF